MDYSAYDVPITQSLKVPTDESNIDDLLGKDDVLFSYIKKLVSKVKCKKKHI